MLGTAELADLRGALEDSLPDSCVIMRGVAGTSDGMGGYIGGSSSAAGTVDCRVSPTGLQPGEVEMARQVGAAQVWEITMPANTDIRATDRITSGTTTYEVVDIRGPRSYELHRRVVCLRVG